MPAQNTVSEKFFFLSTLITGVGSSVALLFLLIIAGWTGVGSRSFDLLLLVVAMATMAFFAGAGGVLKRHTSSARLILLASLLMLGSFSVLKIYSYTVSFEMVDSLRSLPD